VFVAGFGGAAYGINNAGQACGGLEIGVGAGRAFLYLPAPAYAMPMGLNDLGMLPGGAFSVAEAVNNAGMVVGRSDQDAVLWYDGAIVALNGLLPPGTGWLSLSHAYDVNNAGMITGYGSLNGDLRAFLLIPGNFVQTPASAEASPSTPCANDPGPLTLTATGGAGNMLAWYTGGCGNTLIGTGSPLFIPVPAETTTYYARWEGQCVTSNCVSVDVTVLAPPSIAAQSADATVCEGEPVSLWVTANGASPLFYQWEVDGATIPGATEATYNIGAATVSDAGAYTCVVSNVCGATTSAPISVAVNTLPSITAQPESQDVCEGDAITFTVAATGTPLPSYQWRKDGADLTGATSPSYVIDPVGQGDAGAYDVVVTNVCGSATSGPAVLTVWTVGSGDTNGDGNSNGSDVQSFIEAILTPQQATIAQLCAADTDGNGVADPDDIPQFIAILLGQ
jgi:hypothetical protein